MFKTAPTKIIIIKVPAKIIAIKQAIKAIVKPKTEVFNKARAIFGGHNSHGF